jgi:uncharacterized membrane protein YqjE
VAVVAYACMYLSKCELTVHLNILILIAIIEYIWNVDHTILNTVFENTVRHDNKCLETGGGHFEHYL